MALKSGFFKLSAFGLIAVTTTAFAGRDYPQIYPFVPVDQNYIQSSVKKMSEDPHYIQNFKTIVNKNLSKGKTFKKQKGKKTETQPWGSTFWPLNRGLIADAYSDNVFGAYNPLRMFSWEHNRNRYLKRAKKIHEQIDSLTSEELADLAPSEKYDLLLGDKKFHLTNKIWSYMQSWGSMKDYGMLHSIDKVGGKSLQRAQETLNWGWFNGDRDQNINNAVQTRGGLAEKFAMDLVKEGRYSSLEEALPEGIQIAQARKDNYVIKEKNTYMATWEGICHGWSTASGIVPRPRKSVTFKLRDGRDLKFYPEDIKGLVSYMWANSLIQDGRWYDNQGKPQGGGILMQGLRCNEKSPKTDEWGRYYDSKPDAFSGKHEARCVGVHPAIWHLGLVNIVGKQGRSFIVERKVKAAVDNHPLYKYEMEYFNPYTGREVKNIMDAVKPITKSDQFRDFRSSKAKYIVGVETEMVYLDWERPQRKETNSEEDDTDVEKTMFYDLELDENYNIVGGQWRAVKTGKPGASSVFADEGSDQESLNHKQPDFFWVVTKDWKNWFNEMNMQDKWTDTRQAPPASWKKTAEGAHNFIYYHTYNYGNNLMCEVVNKNNKRDIVKVPCEYTISKPQPLINVVNKLIELSK